MFNLVVKVLKSNFWFFETNATRAALLTADLSARQRTLAEQATNKNAL